MPVWTWLASLGVHGLLVGGFGALTYYHLTSDPPSVLVPNERGAVTTSTMDLPGFADGMLLVDREPDPQGEAPVAAGGDTTPRLDTKTAGHGGDTTAKLAATHLADKDEALHLSPDLVSRLDRDQEARLRSSHERRAWEDRRATPNPTELTFLASGDLERMERRTPSPFDPSRGVLASPAAAVLGAARLGSLGSAPGVGVKDGRPGDDHGSGARVAQARPDVTQGPVTVPALLKGRPNDDVDSEQEVATTVRSLVHASAAGGLLGDGRGGTGGGGAPGAGGGTGDGSHPRPLGVGDGSWFDLETNDPRLLPYFRSLHKKIDPLWANAFPRSAILDLKQGTVILEFTIGADGTVSVTWPPVRPSGIDEFDKNCADALRRASPVPPIPKELGRTSLRIRAPFIASNPIVK
jgi:TonB family protein